MKKSIYLASIAGLLLLPVSAWAAATPEPEAIAIVQEALKAATDDIFSDLLSWGVRLLSLFVLVQFVLTNITLLGRGSDWGDVWTKFLGSLAWFGFCFWVMDAGAPFMKETAAFFYGKAGHLAGGAFTPGYALNFGLALTNNLLVALDNTQGILASLNPFPSIMLGVVSVAILGISALIAFKVFMLIAETAIVIALSPMSFALLGLNALKDQGLAPLKYLIAMGYRAIILGAVIAAMSKLGIHINAVFEKIPSLTDTGVWTPIWAATLGYGLLGMFAVKADSIAAMLASGTSQMSTGDAASSVAAAAAAGGMVGGGVVATGGLARDVANGAQQGASAIGKGASAVANMLGAEGGGKGAIARDGKDVGKLLVPDAAGPSPTSPAKQTQANAAVGVQVAGGSREVAKAASDAVASGGSSADIAAAVERSGGTPAQATAGAVAAAMGDPKQLPREAFNAGIDAAAAGKSPEQIGQAIRTAGGSNELASAASTAAQQAQGVQAQGGNASDAGIGGTTKPGSAAAPGASSGQRGFLDRLGEANQHIAQENSVVSVSLNTHAD